MKTEFDMDDLCWELEQVLLKGDALKTFKAAKEEENFDLKDLDPTEAKDLK